MINHNAQTLAYVGDAVFELFVREHLVRQSLATPETLHDKAVEMTSAEGQAKILEGLMPHLTDDERDLVRRGRNAKLTRKSRAATRATYQRASGLEALFGYLYLTENLARLRELFNELIDENPA